MARSFDLNFSLVSKAHRRAQAYREALDTQRVAPQLSTQVLRLAYAVGPDESY